MIKVIKERFDYKLIFNIKIRCKMYKNGFGNLN